MLKLIKKMLSGEPSCREVNKFLVEYLDGELDSDVQERFRTHLADCNCCHSFLERYRKTIVLTNEAGAVDLPPELVETTLSFLRRNLRDGGTGDPARTEPPESE